MNNINILISIINIIITNVITIDVVIINNIKQYYYGKYY